MMAPKLPKSVPDSKNRLNQELFLAKGALDVVLDVLEDENVEFANANESGEWLKELNENYNAFKTAYLQYTEKESNFAKLGIAKVEMIACTKKVLKIRSKVTAYGTQNSQSIKVKDVTDRTPITNSSIMNKFSNRNNSNTNNASSISSSSLVENYHQNMRGTKLWNSVPISDNMFVGINPNKSNMAEALSNIVSPNISKSSIDSDNKFNNLTNLRRYLSNSNTSSSDYLSKASKYGLEALKTNTGLRLNIQEPSYSKIMGNANEIQLVRSEDVHNGFKNVVTNGNQLSSSNMNCSYSELLSNLKTQLQNSDRLLATSKKLLRSCTSSQKRTRAKKTQNVLPLTTDKSDISNNAISGKHSTTLLQNTTNTEIHETISIKEKSNDLSNIKLKQEGDKYDKYGEEMSEYEKLRENNIASRNKMYEDMKKSAIVAGERMRPPQKKAKKMIKEEKEPHPNLMERKSGRPSKEIDYNEVRYSV